MGGAERIREIARSLLIAGAATLALAPPARGQSTVEAFVATVSDGLNAIPAQAAGDKAKTVAACRDFLSRSLDLQEMAQAASRDAWPRMSAAQRDEYRAAFTQRLATQCGQEFAGYHGEAITLAGVRTTPEGDKLVALRLGADTNARIITWRLRGHDDQYVAVDVIFEGHSAVVDAHDQFTIVLHATRGDIDAVIKAVKALVK